MKYFILILLTIILNSIVFSQESLEKLIELVKQNNKTLKVAESKYKLEIASYNTGLNPENPEIELGYLIGSPKDIGNRTDFSISQSFDFPTSYIHKRKASRVQVEKAKYSKKITEQEVILKTKKVWLNQVFWNKIKLTLSSRVYFANKIKKQYEKKHQLGEISQIDINRINLRISLLRNEFDKADLQSQLNKHVAYEISNDTTFVVKDTVFPANSLISRDSIISLYKKSPTNKYLSENVKFKEHQSKIIFSEKLPKINVGYYSERIANENFKGAKIGFTIPIWENKNRRKQAKTDIILAEAELEKFEIVQNSSIHQLIKQKQNLNKRKVELSESISKINNLTLLRKALSSGEISLSEYYFESDYYFRAIMELIEIERDEFLIEFELLKIIE